MTSSILSWHRALFFAVLVVFVGSQIFDKPRFPSVVLLAFVLTYEIVLDWGLACFLPFHFGYTTIFQGPSIIGSCFWLSPFFGVWTCGPLLVVH